MSAYAATVSIAYDSASANNQSACGDEPRTRQDTSGICDTETAKSVSCSDKAKSTGRTAQDGRHTALGLRPSKRREVATHSRTTGKRDVTTGARATPRVRDSRATTHDSFASLAYRCSRVQTAEGVHPVHAKGLQCPA